MKFSTGSQMRSEQRPQLYFRPDSEVEKLKWTLPAAKTMVIDQELRKYKPNLKAPLSPVEKGVEKNHIITMKLDNKEDKEISETLEKIYTNRMTRLSQSQIPGCVPNFL